MPTRGRGRGRKQAEKTQENVVDSTTATLNGRDADGVDGAEVEENSSHQNKNRKKPTKRKHTTKEESTTTASDSNPTPDPDVPAKRGRGKTTTAKESKKQSEDVPKSTRSSKRTPTTNGVDKKSTIEDAPTKDAKGKSKGKPPATKKESEPKKRPSRKRGDNTIKSNETETPEDQQQLNNGDLTLAKIYDKPLRHVPAPPLPPLRQPRQITGRRKRIASPSLPEINYKREESDNEMVPENDVKPKKGRGKAQQTAAVALDTNENDADAPEEKKPVKTAGAKKMMVESSGRIRKRDAEIAGPDNLDDNGQIKGIGDSETAVGTKKRKAEKKTSKKTEEKFNNFETNYTSINFEVDKEHNLKISSWNISGIRAWVTKNGTEYVKHEKPDILCLQEIKCIPELIPEEARLPGYHPYWLCKPGGYAGVAIYSKIMPINVEYGIGDDEHDAQGRIMTAEYEKFYLICVYVPNSGRKLVTLPKRLQWNTIFDEYVEKLNAIKPVIICGDMNVAHTEIDLANPKTNKKNAGFTQEERDGMSKLLSLGYIDTFRYLYPKLEKVYTFWSFMMNARAKNVGWRLDYFIVSERFMPKVVDNIIRSDVLGSDHCPITLVLKV